MKFVEVERRDMEPAATEEPAVSSVQFDDFEELFDEESTTDEEPPAVPSPRSLASRAEAFFAPRSRSPSPARLPDVSDDAPRAELAAISVEHEAGRPEVSDADFERLGVLGLGSFGKVVLARHKTTRALYALKLVSLARLVDQKQVERMLEEKRVLEGLEHPCVVRLHFAFRTPGHACLGFEYCAGGELFHHLCRRRRLEPDAVAFYGAEIALALQCAHEHGVVYRDVKPENCFLDAAGHLKLGDFGLAKGGVRDPFRGAFSVCGTPEYMAPDVLAQHPAGYGTAVDFWGMGVCLYELLTGMPPWYTTERKKLFERIVKAPLRIPPDVPVDAGVAISRLLRRHPRQRLCAVGGADALRTEPFFASVDFDALVLGAVRPPIRPCRDLRRPAHRVNFDYKFTKLSVATPVEGPLPDFVESELEETTWGFVR